MPAKKYRIGVIGSSGRGDYGHGIDVVWQRIPEAEIVAVADDDPAGLAKAAERLGVNKTYADYRKLLDEAKPDIVSVCPRWIDRHHAMAMAALARGIHVLMEKPMCRTLADGGLVAGNELIARDLLASIEEHRPPAMGAIEARAAIEMIVACFESARVGGPVSLPLAARDNPLTRLAE